MIFKKIAGLAALAMACTAGTAGAAISSINAVPTAWRLENYMGNNVVVWGAGAPECTGNISFDSNATTDDRNRFWATIMTGKAAAKKVFIYYDTATCKIVSFGLLENG